MNFFFVVKFRNPIAVAFLLLIKIYKVFQMDVSSNLVALIDAKHESQPVWHNLFSLIYSVYSLVWVSANSAAFFGDVGKSTKALNMYFLHIFVQLRLNH
jgi:hypothetical protein